MPDSADLTKLIFAVSPGTRSRCTSRSWSPPFIAVALGALAILGALSYFRLWGPFVARLDHQHRPQEDRRHVHRARAGDAAARLSDAIMNARPAGAGLRRFGRLPAAAPLRPDLHGARRGHDLLRRDAADRRADELRRAAADRRARRGLPVPQQLQLLDDDLRPSWRWPRCSSASSRAPAGLPYPPLSGIAYSPDVGVDYYIWSLQVAGSARCCRA